MEITVSMLVSAIVVMVTFTAYRIISNSYEGFTKQGRAFEVLIRLDEWLKGDFSQAAQVFKTDEGISIQKEGGQVSYRFLPDEIIRDAAVPDTFKLAVMEWSGFFEGAVVTVLSGEETSQSLTSDVSAIEAPRIDQLDLTIRFLNENVPCSYHKKYSSHNLMQRKADALN